MADPTKTGERVLAGLEKGRQIAIAESKYRAEKLERLVVRAAALDAESGRPHRGRPRRVAKKLLGWVSVRHVYRILNGR